MLRIIFLGIFACLVNLSIFANIYTVKKHDTLYGIAREYGITVDQLKGSNQIEGTGIYVGQKLTIPQGQKPLVHIQTIQAGNRGNQGLEFYCIQKGDTWYGLSKQLGVSVDQLQQLNHLQTKNLYVGQKIIVPTYDHPKNFNPNQDQRNVWNGQQTQSEINQQAQQNRENQTPAQKTNQGQDGDILSQMLSSQKQIGSDPVAQDNVHPRQISQELVKNKKNTQVTPTARQLFFKKQTQFFHRSNDTDFVWPIQGQIKSTGGRLKAVIIVPQKGSSQVRSISSGRVVYIGFYRNFSNVILISKGDYIYGYAGLQSVEVHLGESIYPSEEIGSLLVGSESSSNTYVPISDQAHIVGDNRYIDGSDPGGQTTNLGFFVFYKHQPYDVALAPRG